MYWLATFIDVLIYRLFPSRPNPGTRHTPPENPKLTHHASFGFLVWASSSLLLLLISLL